MNKSALIPVAILSSIIAMSPAHAARSKTQQAVVGGSTFVGVTVAATVAAGPIGLVVGSIAAAFLAKQTQLSNDNEIKLAEATSQHEELRTAMTKQDSKIRSLEQETVQKLTFQILFATGEDALNDLDLRRVNILASHLNSNPTLNVSLNGHADPRGTDGYNNILSQERAKAIKVALISQGIDEGRITTKGHGSTLSNATKGDLESYQQDRRVDIEMEEESAAATFAKN